MRTPIERRTFSVGLTTVVSVAFALIAATAAAVTAWSQTVTKAELTRREAGLQTQVTAASAEAQAASSAAAANTEKLGGMEQIHGRLDFLVEAALEEARTSPRSRRAVETAMRKVRARARARGLGDPIADLAL